MESNEQNKLTDKMETLIDAENKLTASEGRGLDEKGKEIKKKKTEPWTAEW